MTIWTFKSPKGRLWHSTALLYVFGAYCAGWWLLLTTSWWGLLPSALLLGHGMIIAAYLVHDCAHNTVFKKNQHNAQLGKTLGWICGSCYGKFEDIRYKHFRHHVDNDDVVWFDYEAFFKKHPAVYRATIFLEWFYIPAHDILMHSIMVLTAFVIPKRRDQMGRNTLVIVIRGGLLIIIGWTAPIALLGYCLAYMMMIIVLRFVDGLEHDYPYHLNLFTDDVSEHKGDLVWEQEHTFSPILSWRYPWVNWLILNFGYHNAHHAKPTAPWYELPSLHKQRFGDDPNTVIRLWPQLKMYHRYRAYRIFHDAPGIKSVSGKAFLKAAQEARLTGGNAASFLTSF
ncbi:MAG: fatty acid desaturase [Gammaproteobacteria bacterium]|nr:fatty acid desaturase [Gammaproteobacteria bacterium]